MLKVKSLKFNEDVVTCVFNASATEELVLAGRLVQMDLGTVGTIERTTVNMQKGDNTFTLNVGHPQPLEETEHAVYLDVVFPTADAYLTDSGPYKFGVENGS